MLSYKVLVTWSVYKKVSGAYREKNSVFLQVVCPAHPSVCSTLRIAQCSMFSCGACGVVWCGGMGSWFQELGLWMRFQRGVR